MELETARTMYQAVVAATDFAADAVTVKLGVVAIWGLLFRRRQIARFLQMLTSTHLNQRIIRVKVTLGILERLNYENKEMRGQITNLLAQLRGDLSVLVGDFPRLQDSYDLLVALDDGRTRLNESIKHRLISALHGTLDNITLDHQTEVVRGRDE